MSQHVSDKARYCLQRSIKDLHKHIFLEFVTTSSSKRNLQSGILAKKFLYYSKRAALDETDLWKSLFDLCLVQGRSWQALEFPEGFHFNLSWPLLWYLERLDPKDGESFNVVLSLRLWEGYITGLSRLQKRFHIKRFCDWVEAEIALLAYYLFKKNKNCFQENEFASFVNILVERLNLGEKSFTAGERDQIFSQAISELKLDYNQTMPIWEASKLHEPVASGEWQYQALDCWLFQIWPLVKHFDWTMKELSAVIEKKKLTRPTGKFASLDLDSYPCHPDDIGQHVRTVLGLRHEDRPKGQPKPRVHADANLPPRWLLAIPL